MQGFVSRLMIFRHAHAAKATPGQDDFDRPLDERGRREAVEIGAAALGLGLMPELVLCSPAVRTRETLAEAGAGLADVAAEHPERLYPGDAASYLDAVQRVGSAASIMLIGHNPGIAELATLLAGNGDAKATRRLERGFPTAGLAVFEFDVPPAEIGSGTGHLRHFLVPER